MVIMETIGTTKWLHIIVDPLGRQNVSRSVRVKRMRTILTLLCLILLSGCGGTPQQKYEVGSTVEFMIGNVKSTGTVLSVTPSLDEEEKFLWLYTLDLGQKSTGEETSLVTFPEPLLRQTDN